MNRTHEIDNMTSILLYYIVLTLMETTNSGTEVIHGEERRQMRGKSE